MRTAQSAPDRALLPILVVITAVDLVMIVGGPVLYLLAAGGPKGIDGTIVGVVAVGAIVVVPALCVALWLALRNPLAEQRRRRRREIVRVSGQEADLTVDFQPIVHARTGAVLGHEALTRLPGPSAPGPAAWFADSHAADLGCALELRAVAAALRRFPSGAGEAYLSVNVSPETMERGELLPLLLAGPVPPARIVVELTEHSPIEDYEPVRRARIAFRRHGIRLAVDDAGSGYASFRHIVATDPDIIKIDHSLVIGLDEDPARTELVRSIIAFAKARGAGTVAEGVEHPADARRGTELGVDALQGTLIGDPR